MTNLDPDQLKLLLRERRLSSGFLLIVLAIGVFDVLEDVWEGESLSHMVIEGGFILIAILGAIYLWRESRNLRLTNLNLDRKAKTLHKDAEHWRQEAAQALQGLGAAIEKQFALWQLTAAESEVGVLLLKGLSFKEVADARGTSEKTVRLQATAVYKKSGLDGRAELSAFFLEDLLLPHSTKEGAYGVSPTPRNNPITSAQ